MKKVLCLLLTVSMLLCLELPVFSSSYSDYLLIDKNDYYIDDYHEDLLHLYNFHFVRNDCIWKTVSDGEYLSYMKFADLFKDNAAVKMAGLATGQTLSYEKYIAVLSIVLKQVELNTNELITTQASFDTKKKFLDYAADVAGIVADTVLFQAAGKSLSGLKKSIVSALGITDVVMDLTIDSIGMLETVERMSQAYIYAEQILAPVERYSTDPELARAAASMLSANRKMFLYKLDVLNEYGIDVAVSMYEDLVVDGIFSMILENPEKYPFTDDELDALKGLDALSKGATGVFLSAKIGTFVGDVVIGSSDVLNRTNEVIVLSEIRKALVKQSNSYIGKVDGLDDLETIDKLVKLAKAISYIDYRGEYSLTEMVVSDGKLMSLLKNRNGDSVERQKYMEAVGRITKNLGNIYDGVFPDLELYKICEPYRFVEPTQDELDEIGVRLFPILCDVPYGDYDCETDSILSHLIHYPGWLNFGGIPEYEEEMEKYIAEKWSGDEWRPWTEEHYGPDPLGKFDLIPGVVFSDDYSEVDWDTLYDNYTSGKGHIYGYYKHSLEIVEWLAEGVWNGQMSMDSEYGYAYDGCFYTPMKVWEAGKIVPDSVRITDITPLDDFRYEIAFDTYYEESYDYSGTAVVALKEKSDNGFRFWSVLRLEKN